MARYLIPNGPMPTTAAQVAVTTGTAIKTMLQVKLEATFIGVAKIVEWGLSFNGFAAALPIKVELLTTGTVKATITEHVATGILSQGGLSAAVTDGNPFDFTAAADGTGFTATVEGTITATRQLDVPQFIAPTTQFVKQFPLGREPDFDPAEYMRIRVTAGTAVDCYCYVVVEV